VLVLVLVLVDMDKNIVVDKKLIKIGNAFISMYPKDRTIDMNANIGNTIFPYDFEKGSLDLEALMPLMTITLYERLNICVNCWDSRDKKLPLEPEFIKINNIGPCICDLIGEFLIRHIIISVVGNPVSTLPLEAIYHIDAVYGIKHILPDNINNISLRKDIDGLERIAFSIYESMDGCDLTNKDNIIKLFTYARKYYRITGLPDKCEINYFNTFKGLKKYDAYGLQFLNLVENYMKHSLPGIEMQREQKENPHVGRKKKNKKEI